MERIKIQNKIIKKSIKLIMPVDGLVQVDSEGIVEVSEKCASIMLLNGWQKVVSENKTKESKEKDNSEENIESKLSGMSVNELKDLAREVGFTEEEIKVTKKVLIGMLMSKYAEANEEESKEKDNSEE
jgi:hypothetical protein